MQSIKMTMKMMIRMPKRYLYLAHYLMFALTNNHGKFQKWKWVKAFSAKVSTTITMCNTCKLD